MQDGESFRYILEKKAISNPMECGAANIRGSLKSNYQLNFVSQSPNCAGSRSTSQRHSNRERDVLCPGCNDSRKKHLQGNAVRLDAFNDVMQRGIN